MNTPLLTTATRVWLMEVLVSGFNFFVLMNLIYEPRCGVLAAHQIGMITRIVYIFIFAYFLLLYVKEYETKDLLHVGILWLGLTLLFEWGGQSCHKAPSPRNFDWLERIRGIYVAVCIAELFIIKPHCWYNFAPRQSPKSRNVKLRGVTCVLLYKYLNFL